MNNTKFKNWIKQGLNKGFDDLQIHINEKEDLSLNVYKQKVEQNEISKMNTAHIKAIYNGKAVNITLEDLSDENYLKTLDELIDNAKHITAKEPALIYEGSKKYEVINDEMFDFKSIKIKDKIDLLIDIESQLLKNKYIKNVSTVSYSEVESKTTIINSKGLNLKRHNKYAMIYSSAAYEKNEQVKTGLSYQIVNDYNEIDKNYLVNENIKNGTNQLGAKTIKSGKYPVVFDQEQFGNIINVFESIFTGEAAYRNLTKLKGLENKQIASEIVNLVDVPLHDESIFKIPFDDEGVATKENYWIKDGVFKGFVHNLKTAKIFNEKPTGNGFSNSIRSSNLTLLPGNKTFEQLLNTIDKGILITGLIGLHAGVEVVSGNFSLQASGFIIEKGQITKPVDMIVLSGNFFELLNNIELIANDFKFGLSGVGTSSVKIKELAIAGE